METILKLDGVEKVYHPGTNLECRALQPVNLEFCKGRFYAIVGKSGSGKSTMLHILGGTGPAHRRQGVSGESERL